MRLPLPPLAMATVFTLGCASTACHLVKVNGKPLGSPSSPKSTSAQPAAASNTPAQAANQPESPASEPAAAAPAKPSYASTSGIKISKSSAPHPLLTERIQVKMDDVRTDDRGWRKCGGGFTTEQPALTWELQEDMSDLKVRLENSNGGDAHTNATLVLPNGNFVCSDDSQFFFSDWTKGTYALFFSSISIGASAHVRFESPERSKREVLAALEKARTIPMTSSDVTPRFESVSIDTKLHAFAENLGVSCHNRHGLSSKGRRIAPVAKLKVSKESDYHVDVRGASTFVLTSDNKCAMSSTKHLIAGTHTLWAIFPTDAAPVATYDIEIDDLQRAIRPAKAKTEWVQSLETPLVIKGKVRTSQAWGSRRGLCRDAARVPDAYISATDLLENVRLSLLWSESNQHLHVFGPIEKAEKYTGVDCGEKRTSKHEFKLFEGTYAVWVGSPKNTKPGSDFHLLVRSLDNKVAPMTSFAPIATDLSMESRRLWNHYPFFSGQNIDNWQTMFTQAPDGLFVFPRKKLSSRSGEVPEGEPLLVKHSGQNMTLLRYDGTQVSADKQLLTTKRPSRIVLPKKANPPDLGRLSAALSAAGPEDAKGIAAYNKADKKYGDCSYKYMRKHDPTWGKGHEVYKITRGGRVKNVGDEVADRAYNKCGGRKVDKLADGLVKKLAKTRAQRYQKQLMAVRKRFGI